MNSPGDEPLFNFVFTYTFEDYRDAHKVFQEFQAYRSGWVAKLLPWIFVASLLVIVLLMPLVSSPSTPILSFESILNVLPYVIIIGMAFVLIVFTRKRAWKMQEKVLSEPRTLAVYEDGLALISATMSIRYQWAAFSRVMEGRATFVLPQSGLQFLMIPKRVMTEVQVAQLRALFNDRIRPVQGGFPVQPPMTPKV